MQITGTQDVTVNLRKAQVTKLAVDLIRETFKLGSETYLEDNQVCVDYKMHTWQTDKRKATEEEKAAFLVISELERR